MNRLLDPRRPWTRPAAVCLYARIPFLLLILVHPERAVVPDDSTHYWQQGLRLAHHSPIQGWLWPWGYPAMLSVFHFAGDVTPFPIALFQVGAACAATVAIQRLGARFAGERGGVIAGLAYALSPAAAMVSVLILPEASAIALVAWATVLALAAAERQRVLRARLLASAASGVLLGCAFELSGFAQYCIPIIALFLAGRFLVERSWAPVAASAVLTVTAAAAALPWVVHVWSRWGAFSGTQQAGNLLMDGVSAVLATTDGDRAHCTLLDALEEHGIIGHVAGADCEARWKAAAEPFETQVWGRPDRNGQLERLAFEMFAARKVATARTFVANLTHLVLGGGSLSGRGFGRLIDGPDHVSCAAARPACFVAAVLASADFAWFLLLGVAAVAGVVLGLGGAVRERALFALMVSLLVYLYATTAFHPTARHRLRSMPFDAPCAAVAVELVLARRKEGRRA